MSKRDHHFLKIREYKERFSKQTSEALKTRLRDHTLIKEPAIAAREILAERGEPEILLLDDQVSNESHAA